MIKCYNWPVGVCSWSAGDDIAVLAKLKEEIGLDILHLNLVPLLEKKHHIADYQTWKISSTMIAFPQEDYTTLESIKKTGGIVPDDCWEENRLRVLKAIDITANMKVEYLSFHVGFIEENNAEKLYKRMKLLADEALARDVMLLMETGQESDQMLRTFLEKLDHQAVGINFDPANMILYNTGNPIKAVAKLAPWLRHIHIKDAVMTSIPGTWGAETNWGDGQVGGEDFLKALKKTGFSGALAIEREIGNKRDNDIKLTVNRLRNFSG